MSVALPFVDKHICKQGPTEVAEFNLQSSQQSELFRGVVNVGLNIAKSVQTNGHKKKVTHKTKHSILVEMERPNLVASGANSQVMFSLPSCAFRKRLYRRSPTLRTDLREWHFLLQQAWTKF